MSGYYVAECKAWTKPGCSPVAAHCLPAGEGWSLEVTGYRVKAADGAPMWPSRKPFATRAEAQAMADSLNETAPAPEWSYGWNQPGYLPDTSDAAESWEGARDALVFELERADEGAFGATEAQLETAAAELKGAPEGEPVEIPCGTFVLWIMRADAPSIAGAPDSRASTFNL